MTDPAGKRQNDNEDDGKSQYTDGDDCYHEFASNIALHLLPFSFFECGFDWQGNIEGAADGGVSFYPDTSPVRFDQDFGDG